MDGLCLIGRDVCLVMGGRTRLPAVLERGDSNIEGESASPFSNPEAWAADGLR
jgi:hypothetical protein